MLELVALLSLATAPVPAAPPPLSADVDDEAEAPAVEPAITSNEPSGPRGEFSYSIATMTRVEVGSGRTTVATETGFTTPLRGYFPLRVFIDNTRGPAQTIALSYRASVGSGSTTVSQDVEVRAFERITATLLVPAALRAGVFTAQGPGITEGGRASLYFNTSYGTQRVVLLLGTPDSFKRLVNQVPSYDNAEVQVYPLSPGDAPRQLAAYVGFDAVVLADISADLLDDGQRRALEEYAATGGRLIVGNPSRAMKAAFVAGRDAFGAISFCAQGCDGRALMPSEPRALAEARVVSSNSYRGYPTGTAFEAMLPQAIAPLGRFLLIITAFALAIGPGSLWVARRRGTATLLLTIPATAIVTCVAIIVFSLLRDGFSVHASSLGYTLLDSARHRAVTLAVNGYYANLAPSHIHLPDDVVAVGPANESASVEWKNGARFRSDFLPSRTYREWGFLAVTPSRARVVVKPNGQGVRIQNALGLTASTLVVRYHDRWYRVLDLRDGQEKEGQPSSGLIFDGTAQTQAAFDARLPRADAFRGTTADSEGTFVAYVDGPGLAPTAGLALEHHNSAHLISGQVER